MKSQIAKSLLICMLFSANSMFAQTDITIGKTYTITSQTLNQERDFHVYLPDGYEDSNKEYPVLYILDGQWHFTNGVAIQKSLRVPDHLPEMIVVGIQNENPLRRTLFWDDREKFLGFLETELLPYVDNTFRTSNDRILFGWEAGAFFANYAILNDKQLFNAAIITDGAYATEEMIDEFDELTMTNKKYLFMANSIKDIYYVESSNSFAKLLTDKSPENLTWKYELFNNEVHESLAYLALYHGLINYYHDFNSPVFSSIKEFKDSGGIAHLKEYFKTRGERYGFPTKISDSAKNGLIWLAWNRDDFQSFHEFMVEFEDVLSTKRYASAYWQNRFGQFYLKHNDYSNAIKYFNAGITGYPESSRLAEMYSGIGSAYLGKGDKKFAIKHVQRAIRIAKTNGDGDLKTYEKQLETIRK